MSLGGGDKLARGAAKAQFPSNSSISEEKWNAIFGEFDPEQYRRDADEKSAGDVSPIAGEDKSDS
jgi:hypothetical protein